MGAASLCSRLAVVDRWDWLCCAVQAPQRAAARIPPQAHLRPSSVSHSFEWGAHRRRKARIASRWVAPAVPGAGLLEAAG